MRLANTIFASNVQMPSHRVKAIYVTQGKVCQETGIVPEGFKPVETFRSEDTLYHSKNPVQTDIVGYHPTRSDLFGPHGDTLNTYTLADVSMIKQELEQIQCFKSEMDLNSVYDLFNKMTDSARDKVGILSQCDTISRIVRVLQDPEIQYTVNFDHRRLADLSSQVLIALKLLTNEPTFVNIVLVFTSFLSKLDLSPETSTKCIRYIEDAVGMCVASISTLGMKSEASLASMVGVLTSLCDNSYSLVNDQVVDIVLTFLSKLVSFWTTLSGGFKEEDFDISSIPAIVDRMRNTAREGGDIIECILAAYDWLSKNFQTFYKGDFSPLWFGKAETNVFEAKVSRVKRIYPLVDAGSWDILKEEYSHTETSYALEVDKLIKTCHSMMRKAKPAQMPAFKRCLDELREIQVKNQMKQTQTQTKVTAYGVCFVGPSGVGKSLLMDQTARVLISAAGEVPTSDKIVTGQMSDKFDSNEQPHHLAFMYDDVSNNSRNENFDKLLNAVNSQARPLLKAAVEEKGLKFPNNVACVISTNVPGLNAENSNCPDSICRRFIHIDTKIKEALIPEVCVPGTRRVDTNRATVNGEPRMDIWDFDVYEFLTFDSPGIEGIPEGSERWNEMTVRRLEWTTKDMVDRNYWDLALFLAKLSKKHFDTQKGILEVMRSRMDYEYCELCCIPTTLCPCSMSSEFMSVDFDLSMTRMVDTYVDMTSSMKNMWNIAKFRTVLAIVLSCTPIDIRNTLIVCLFLSCVMASCISTSIIFLLPCIVGLTLLFYMGLVIHTWLRLRERMATTTGVLTYLADESLEVMSRNRNSIFWGATMVSFLYLIYRNLRPSSEQISYRESLPENLRNAFARSERAKTTPLDNIIPHMKKDIGTLIVKDDRSERMCLTFPIEANCYLTVGHILPSTGDFELTIQHENALTPTVAKQKLSQHHIYRFPGKDLALIQVPSAVPRRGYKDYLLAKPALLGSQVVKIISMELDTKRRLESDTRLEVGWNIFQTNVTTDRVTIEKPYRYLSPIGTRDGMCGSLVVDYQKAIIYGFHVAGNGKTGLCSTLTQQEVNEALACFHGFIPLNQGDLQLGSHCLEKDAGFCTLAVGDPEHDKPLEEHNCLTEGIIPNGSATFRHPYRKHPFYDDIVEQFGPEKYAPPQGINDDFHKRKALTKLTSPNQEFSLDEIDFAVQDYIGPIVNRVKALPSTDLIELSRPLSVQEALDGVGETCLGGVDNSTSVGFPFRGKKKNFLERDPFDPDIPMTPRKLRPNDDVDMLEEVSEMKKRYLSGISCRPLFKCSMKTNELLPRNKYKARVFMGSNFPFLILCRQYLAPIIRIISRNRFLFETAKGINMDSIEAEELYNYLNVEGGKRIVALDYSAYDQTMSAQATNAAASIIMDLLRMMKCSADHIQIVRGLLTDIIYPNLHYFGTVIQLANSDPSGNPITTELNGIVNSLYLRVFFFRIYSDLKGKITYREAIRTMTYGDDNINGVLAKYEKFNGINIVKEGAKVGLTITMADKGADVVEFTDLEDSDFLKRKFRFCKDLGHIRAPLAKDSIVKCLHWMKTTSPEDPNCLFSENVDGVLRKASQHGKEYFEEMRMKLLTIAQKRDVVHICKWWTYDELIDHDRTWYYEKYSKHNIHPSLTADMKNLQDYLSEAKARKKTSIVMSILTFFMGFLYFAMMTRAFWDQWGIDPHYRRFKRKLDRMTRRQRYEFYDQIDNIFSRKNEAYASNGWPGVCEELGLPLWLGRMMEGNLNFVQPDLTDDEDVFRSEGYFIASKPQTTFWLRIFYWLFDSLLSLRPLATTGRLVELGLSSYSYVLTLVACLSYASTIDTTRENVPLMNWISSSCKEARRTVCNVLLRNQSSIVRKQAYCLFIEGPPGTGKTFACLGLIKHLIKDIQRHEIVVLNEEDDFQSELRTYHRVIIMDDIGNTRSDREEANPLRRPLDFVNSTPRRALNPEADLKGLIPIEPELVILTSNVHADKLAYVYSECPSSLFRRWVRVRLSKTGSFSGPFDTSKWLFDIFVPVPRSDNGVRAYHNLQYSSRPTFSFTYDQFLQYIQVEYISHGSEQTDITDRVDQMFEPCFQKYMKRRFSTIRDWWRQDFKSESFEWDSALISRMEKKAAPMNEGEFLALLKEEALVMRQSGLYNDAPKTREDLERDLPSSWDHYPWWKRILLWLGLMDEGFVSNHQLVTVDDLTSVQQYIIRSYCSEETGVIITSDFMVVLTSRRFFPFTLRGLKLANDFRINPEIEIHYETLDSFYPPDTVRSWYKLLKAEQFKSESLEVDDILHCPLTYPERKLRRLIRLLSPRIVWLFLSWKFAELMTFAIRHLDDELDNHHELTLQGFDKTGIATSELSVPSKQELRAQQEAYDLFLSQNPDWVLVCHECEIAGKRIDLLFRNKKEFAIIEAKAKGRDKVKLQAQEHLHALCTIFPHMRAYWYSSTFPDVLEEVPYF